MSLYVSSIFSKIRGEKRLELAGVWVYYQDEAVCFKSVVYQTWNEINSKIMYPSKHNKVDLNKIAGPKCEQVKWANLQTWLVKYLK